MLKTTVKKVKTTKTTHTTKTTTRIAAISLLAACTAILNIAQAGEPPSAPILRLNTPMHTAAIFRSASDADNRFLVTASLDKTAKVWSLQNGALLQTLRLPVGDDDEGALYGLAVDPAGDWVAVGGNTGRQWDGSASVYIFDRRSGQLLQRLAGLPDKVRSLCVSDDGSRLAATLGGRQGVRVWRTDNWALVWQDNNYGGQSYGCDFDRQGWLATTALDATIRLYNPQGKLVKRQATVYGKHPFGIAFNPHGKQLAVGLDDFKAVSVYDSRTLGKLYDADVKSLLGGSVGKVAWSADGKTLYAGGKFHRKDNGLTQVIKWQQQGRGQPQFFSASANSIMSLVPLNNGDVAVASGEPSWLTLKPSGKIGLQRQGSMIDNRSSTTDALWVNPLGNQVATGMDYGNKNPMRFSVLDRRFQPLRSSAAFKKTMQAGQFHSSLPKSASMRVQDWKNSKTPMVNGRVLKLEPYELSRSLAIAPDERSLVLGTEWMLRRYASNGQLQWRIIAPSVVWGLNLAQDGKLIVAGLGDGTIRWYRYSDGQELLALFIDKKTQEWVLWTPGGYYDTSPNGAKLIGWQINNGKAGTPDFYPAKTLRKKFYRPQVISNILATLDEAAAIQVANQQGEKTNSQQSIATALPPTVKIISHHDGDSFNKENITLKVNISRNNGTAKLKVLIDGEPMAKGRGLAALATDKQQRETLDVTLPKRDVTVSVIAENQMGASPAASVRLKWAGKTTTNNASANGGFVVKPKLYVLAVGVSKYRDENLRLDFPAKDAADFVKVLQGQQDKLYREVEVKLLADADKDDIIDGLDWLRDNVTAKDVTMLFLSGHGANDRDNNYQFVAADTDVKRLYRSGVSYTDIKNTLTGLSGKRLAFIDTCHSGNIFGTKSKGLSPMADINGIVNDLTAAENGVVVFAASTGKQLSWEDPKWGNGAFTKAVVEGLGGKADYTKDGKITINQLDLYISERVKKLTDNRQTPVTTKPETVPDFPIGVVK